MKKHRTMFSSQEISFIIKAVKCRTYEFTEYCMERIITRGITTHEVMGAITEGEIVEISFKEEDESVRVLIRGKENKRNLDTCVVLDLCNRSIVTAYQNKSYDKHKWMDMNQYNEQLDIFPIMRQYLDKERVI